MRIQPQVVHWPADRAVLLVHGVGNAQVGDYTDLVRQIDGLLGDQARRFAVYTAYYDQVNDWFMAKQNAGVLFARLIQSLRSFMAGTDIPGSSDPVAFGNTVAEVVGDVIWPVLLADARNAVRIALIDQLNQIVTDGDDAGIRPRDQQLSIIAHSMGCFHVYEMLHSIAADPAHALGPASGGVQFANVIFMASPVQLIRSVAGKIDELVPQRASIRTLSQPLAMPSQTSGSTKVDSARLTASIAGNLDPVGGHFFRARPSWSYTDLPGQISLIDEQQLASINGSDEASLLQLLHSSLRDHAPPDIQPNNPHSWSDYVQRHPDDLRKWLTA